MPEFDWQAGRNSLNHFGGDPISLSIRKTGLPFYDALRLYGAIDLYVGVREDVSICDRGDHWAVTGQSRPHRVRDRDTQAFFQIRQSKKKPSPEGFCALLRESLLVGRTIDSANDPAEPVKGELSDLDPVFQSGVRGVSAADYDTMNSSTDSKCLARIPLSDAILALAGARRTESVGEIRFLPIFQGRIDLGKIVSPLSAWLSVPNPLCAQVLMLLSLKTALWSEGYEKRFTALAYSKKKSRSLNYSGIIQIESTVIGRIDDGEFCSLVLRVFRRMLSASWVRGKARPMASHTLAVAQWLIQPLPSTLRPMIGAQEFAYSAGYQPFLIVPDNVRKVFTMTHPKRVIDFEAVRKLAKAVSSAIYVTGKGEKDTRKHWYNEVVALRNAPHQQAFRYRVLTLIEQSRKEKDLVGTVWRQEAFDPEAVFDSMGDGRAAFEEFRDCFRMYLIQESAPPGKPDEPDIEAVGINVADENREQEETAE